MLVMPRATSARVSIDAVFLSLWRKREPEAPQTASQNGAGGKVHLMRMTRCRLLTQILHNI